jgi:septal ring factor EnvC (AmiA/AmiB activator)
MHQSDHRLASTEKYPHALNARVDTLEMAVRKLTLTVKEQTLALQKLTSKTQELTLRLGECEQNIDYLVKQEQGCQYLESRNQDLETLNAWYLDGADF